MEEEQILFDIIIPRVKGIFPFGTKFTPQISAIMSSEFQSCLIIDEMTTKRKILLKLPREFIEDYKSLPIEQQIRAIENVSKWIICKSKNSNIAESTQDDSEFTEVEEWIIPAELTKTCDLR